MVQQRTIERIKRNWQDFKDSQPGHRFYERYKRRQRTSRGRWDKYTLLNIGLGIVIAAIGVILIPAPGPGWLVTFVGLGLLGSEFAPIARALDWLELKGRAIAEWGERVWNNASTLVKSLVVLCGVAIAATLAYGAYVWFIEG